MNFINSRMGDGLPSNHEHNFVQGKFLPFCTVADCFMVQKEGKTVSIDAAGYIENEVL